MDTSAQMPVPNVGDWVMVQAGGPHLERVEYIYIEDVYPRETQIVGTTRTFVLAQILEIRAADGQVWRRA